MSETLVTLCAHCGQELEQSGRGRPRKLHPECVAPFSADRKTRGRQATRAARLSAVDAAINALNVGNVREAMAILTKLKASGFRGGNQ